jgi:hypothetical protein
MPTTPMYDILLAELANELTEIERKIFNALKANPQGLTRPQLVAIVFHEMTRNVIVNTNTRDRKVRKAIESLRGRLVPIVSNSGQAGYRLDTSEDARQKMLADLRSRRARLDEQIGRVEKFYSIPDVYQPAEHAQQESMF